MDRPVDHIETTFDFIKVHSAEPHTNSSPRNERQDRRSADFDRMVWTSVCSTRSPAACPSDRYALQSVDVSKGKHEASVAAVHVDLMGEREAATLTTVGSGEVVQ